MVATAAVQASATNNMFIFNFAGVPVIVTAIILFIYFKLDIEKSMQEFIIENLFKKTLTSG
jgi:hypothetical protein